MPVSRPAGTFFAAPQIATFLLLTLNILVFAICLYQTGEAKPSSPILLHAGAMTSLALERHEYWRLVAYGFLHATPTHLLGNMLCLTIWGGLLERRLGSTYFLIIYFAAMVLGGVFGDVILAKPYMTVGASAATSGLLGALLCLWILGKIDLMASYFITNIGLNVALTFMDAQINWGAHLVGFTAGLLVCAVLDLIERALCLLLRCKFPEFVKANLLLLIVLGALVCWSAGFGIGASLPTVAAIIVTAYLAVVKLTDLVLARRHGVAIMVILLAVGNGAATFAAVIMNMRLILSACALRPPSSNAAIDVVAGMACAHPDAVAIVAGGIVLATTLLLQGHQLARGLGDVGFVGSSLRAARARSRGL